MKIPRLAIAMGYIDDDLISAAEVYKPRRKKWYQSSWLKHGAIAACLCLVVSVGWIVQHHYYDEGRGQNPPIGTTEKYQVESFAVSNADTPIELFAYSVAPPQEICDVVNQRYPSVNCSHAIYVFSYSEDISNNFWFPIIEDGKIKDIVFATFNSDGKVITGHSESHVDELNAISELTGKNDPLYIVAEEYFNYYIIGNKAYVVDDGGEAESEYIGEFVLPNQDIIVVEIN